MPDIHTRITNAAWREASVASSPELAAKRLNIISRSPNYLKRLGARGLHHLAQSSSDALLSWLARPYENLGLTVIGSGWNSTVLRQDDTAIKIIRDTELMEPHERERYVEHLGRLVSHTTICHPDMAVASEVTQLPHPLTGRPVVAILQPHIDGVDVFSGQMSPEITEQLRLFAEKSLNEMVPNGVAPDLVGQGNILVKNSEAGVTIRLVDTVALQDLDIPYATFPVSVRKLEELATGTVPTRD
jgi:hypothetical protein